MMTSQVVVTAAVALVVGFLMGQAGYSHTQNGRTL